MMTQTHAGDTVVLVERATRIAYRCYCGWTTVSIDPTTPHALGMLKRAMAAHLDALGAPPPAGRSPRP